MKKICVKTSQPYEVLIERGGLAKSGEYIAAVTKSRRTAIITDDIVEKLHLKTVKDSLEAVGFECSVFVFPNGEQDI